MKYAIATLGCKVNQYETQAMELLLHEHGHSATSDGDADVIIVNTCAVTAEGERKSRQAVRRLLRENPGAVAAVCGCSAQLNPDAAERLGAAVVYGSGNRTAFVEAVEQAVTQRQREIQVDDPFRRRTFEPLSAGALDGRTRAYLKIEDGCDQFCAYCIIPYVRGRVRSLPLADAVTETVRLRDVGFQELVITGIEISAYGKDLDCTLTDLLRELSAAAPELRLRLGSLDPGTVTENFCAALVNCGNICPHFHLSLQSGCNRTLSAMGRHYDTVRFAKGAQALRNAFPGCALTADLICGFPGETEEDFRETLMFVEKMAFAAVHVFPYSRRPGTKADTLPNQLDKTVKLERAAQVKALASRLRREYLNAQIGKTLSVLFESQANGLWQGHSANYCLVQVSGDKLRGIMKNVQILAVNGEKLRGIIV